MKTITTYQCDVCGETYKTESEAQRCEKSPVRESKGVKVGDIVLIKTGDGAGHQCRVAAVRVLPPSWGPSRYAHSEYVTGKVIDSWGHRMLTFDAYETL